jgi:transcriptional regulator with XRE-family HTH domain
MSTLKQQLGLRVRDIRKKYHLTQAQLAEKVSLSVNMIGYIERGDRFPSPETFEKLAKVLGIQVEDLFLFPEENIKDPEKNLAEKEFMGLIEGTPTAFVKSVMEIVAAAKRLNQ